MSSAASWDAKRIISQRLSHLYDVIGHVYVSDEHVAEKLRERGFKVTHQYIHQLRTGKRDNPNVQLLMGIAEVLGVPGHYLIADEEEARRVDQQLAFVKALKDSGVSALALRAAELPEESRDFVLQVVEREHRRVKEDRSR